jgi:predicted 3-demethylubiquinone-9 3-methyltransferase (glyoxalase superfamily)
MSCGFNADFDFSKACSMLLCVPEQSRVDNSFVGSHNKGTNWLKAASAWRYTASVAIILFFDRDNYIATIP